MQVVSLSDRGNSYELVVQINCKQSQKDIWELVATTAGYAQWFEELHVSDNQQSLTFEMPNFREEMAVLDWEEEAYLTYEWASARVSFRVEDGQLVFVEDIPKDFPQLYNDLAGWCVQMERLSQLLNHQPVNLRSDRKLYWEKYIKNSLWKMSNCN